DRLERYRPEGLQELRTGIENGYDTVCATTEQNPDLCQIVFTVPPGQNAIATRDRVFENLTLADGGTATSGVNTFAAGDSTDILGQLGNVLGGLSSSSFRSDGIDLTPYLDAADGGTGELLQGGVSSGEATGRRLNPERFR
ncbi:MAG: hypothetical protein F6J97_15440, partial [Leptolyngbya sp. SIO4C1]|nr:hypothetical protein [Leptolyngbya sp. SIO4C1]